MLQNTRIAAPQLCRDSDLLLHIEQAPFYLGLVVNVLPAKSYSLVVTMALHLVFS